MHYANGRAAREGDKVVNLTYGFAGILHTTNANSQTCNGRLAPISQNDPYVTIGECLHIDDLKVAPKAIVDSSAPATTPPSA